MTITVWGELDRASASKLESELLRVEGQGLRVVVLDLRAITFFDTAGVHLLADARERARERGHLLRVRCAGSPVQRVLHLCGLPSSDFEFVDAAYAA